ncbi:hypothetical protein N7499_007669 [Penicillium canescens]|nr:hypothetical protein N7499_007669 [Penicillium canescens]KAJ6158001.1 hypothetical protein N7485_010827 [Penicillium canescens]
MILMFFVKAYSASAGYVPKLANKLLQYLDPQPDDRVLDVGCGDGILTSRFAPHVGYTMGIDMSPMMIEAAIKSFNGSKLDFEVMDCRFLDQEKRIANGSFDKVISNSALHWILRDETTRFSTLRGIHAALRQGGAFVFETGGHGHFNEALTAILHTLVSFGIPAERLPDINPYFFPSESWMKQALEEVGFDVDFVELEYRPTKMTAAVDGGLEGWIRLFGAPLLLALPADKREEAVQQICRVLDPVVTLCEDSSQWLGYVRLRGVAHKRG